ncbi:acyl carrier protein [Pedomonas mirosovicensis]|uniref:acyl carrier protein n=1 Tax=Pedomonas mirosovicensis TaxID=2908641 RepID=UPI002167D80B|nr:acyl carrier protein [Pedomonas mirosovicensis]MCH8684312.1 acyl carrier protein [Pedomonas mirosovicensis]
MAQLIAKSDPAVEARLRDLLGSVLNLGARADGLESDTPLLGALPELDSMAIATLLTALEERFDIIIDDEDVSADIFETFGSLSEFLTAKVAA